VVYLELFTTRLFFFFPGEEDAGLSSGVLDCISGQAHSPRDPRGDAGIPRVLCSVFESPALRMREERLFLVRSTFSPSFHSVNLRGKRLTRGSLVWTVVEPLHPMRDRSAVSPCHVIELVSALAASAVSSWALRESTLIFVECFERFFVSAQYPKFAGHPAPFPTLSLPTFFLSLQPMLLENPLIAAPCRPDHRHFLPHTDSDVPTSSDERSDSPSAPARISVTPSDSKFAPHCCHHS